MIIRLQITIIVIAAICSPLLKSEDTLFIENLREINLCEDRNTIVMSISMGEIAKEDSVFGYDIGIKYDTSLVKFGQGLTAQTFAQYAYFATFNPESPGRAVCRVLKIDMNPFHGDLPLIGFTAEFLGDCIDTTAIEVEFVEFTEEFKGNIKHYQIDNIYSSQNNENSASLRFESDTLHFENADTSKTSVRLDLTEGAEINSFTVKMWSDSDVEIEEKFDFTSIETGLEKPEISKSSDTTFLKYEAFEFKGGKIFDIEYRTEINEKDYISHTNADIILHDECNCINYLSPAKMAIKYQYTDTTVSAVNTVARSKAFKVIHRNDRITIMSESNETIREVVILDLSGKYAMNERFNNEKITEIDIHSLKTGIYFLLVNKKMTTKFTKVK